MPLVPEYIKKLLPYKAGKPIDEVKRELGFKNVVKLASNENPLGPSVKAVRAIEKSLKDIALAKAEIFFNMNKLGTAIINKNDPYYSLLEKIVKNLGIKNIITFGASKIVILN